MLLGFGRVARIVDDGHVRARVDHDAVATGDGSQLRAQPLRPEAPRNATAAPAGILRRVQAVEHLERPRPNVVPRQRQRAAADAGAAPVREQPEQLISRYRCTVHGAGA